MGAWTAFLLRSLWYLFLGFIGGFICIAFITLGLGLIASAFGEEATAVRPATLSEEGISYNYNTMHPILAIMPDTEVIILDTYIPRSCKQHNAGLLAHVRSIAESIAAYPEFGYYYRDVLLTIHSKWCIE